MEKHKRKNKKKMMILAQQEEPMSPTFETTESDFDIDGPIDEFSPLLNPNKPRKLATLLKQGVDKMVDEKNDQVKKNKWKSLMEQYNHKNFVTYLPLPQIQRQESTKIRRSSTLNHSSIDLKNYYEENSLEKLVKETRSEKNIKVSDTLKLLNNI